MNTPDQGPKDGDFVAYLAELERKHLPASHPTGPTGAHPGPAKPVPVVTPAMSGAAASSAAAAAKSIPIGLVAIGLVLIIAGTLFDAGIFVIVIGAFLLWQAIRVMVRGSRETEPVKSQAAQRIANLLATHAARKK